MIRLVATLLTAIFTSAGTLPVSPGCETALYSQITQLVIHAFHKNQVNLDEVKAMSRSSTPVNPLQDVTATSANSSLKRIFSQNFGAISADGWAQTRRELAEWLFLAEHDAVEVHDARVITQDLFLPNSYHEFKKGVAGVTPAFVYVNEKGRLASLHLDRVRKSQNQMFAPTYLEIQELSGGEAPLRVYLGDFYSGEFSAAVTPDGHLRFAVQISTSELKIFAWPDIENSQVLKLIDPHGSVEPLDFYSARPSNFLHAKNGRTYIAASNNASVQVFDLAAPDKPIFTWSTDNKFPNLQLFETSTGRILLSFMHFDQMFSVFDLDQGGKHLMSEKQPSVLYSQAWHESADGSVYLSVHAGSSLRIYKPLENQTLYFEQEVSPAGRPENFWLQGKDGHDYNYVMSSSMVGARVGGSMVKVSVIDATSKQEIFSRESLSFGRGSPFLSGPYGDPRLIISSKTNEREVYVLDPLNPGFPTQIVPISHPIYTGAAGATGLDRFIDPNGRENLVVNGSRNAVLLNLFGRPSL